MEIIENQIEQMSGSTSGIVNVRDAHQTRLWRWKKQSKKKKPSPPPAASDMLQLMHWEGYSVPGFKVTLESTGLCDYKIRQTSVTVTILQNIILKKSPASLKVNGDLYPTLKVLRHLWFLRNFPLILTYRGTDYVFFPKVFRHLTQ